MVRFGVGAIDLYPEKNFCLTLFNIAKYGTASLWMLILVCDHEMAPPVNIK